MRSKNQADIDIIIKQAYDRFMECVSAESKNFDDAKNCLNEILQSLSTIDVDSASSLGQRVSTLKSLINQRILVPGKQEETKEGNVDYSQKFAELGARFIQNPTRKFSDLKGMDEIKRNLRATLIYPFAYKDLSREFGISLGGGVLLYGPPGNGKTLLAEAIAGEAGISFIELNPAYLYNEYFGRYEKNIADLFRLTRETAPNLLFLDEVESLIPRRETSDQSVIKRGVTQLLIEINRLMTENTGGTVIVAATNLPWEIDPAMLRPGRFDQKIYVTLPSSHDRLEIIRDQLNKGYYSRDVDASLIAHRTEGFSFADLIYLFKRATQQAFFQSVEKGTKEHIKMDDILNQISLVKRVYSLDLIRKYELFNYQS